MQKVNQLRPDRVIFNNAEKVLKQGDKLQKAKAKKAEQKQKKQQQQQESAPLITNLGPQKAEQEDDAAVVMES